MSDMMEVDVDGKREMRRISHRQRNPVTGMIKDVSFLNPGEEMFELFDSTVPIIIKTSYE